MKASACREFAGRAQSLFLAGVPISLPHEAFDAAYDFAAAIRDQIVANDLIGGIRHFVDRGDTAWRLLTDGFPQMNARERARLVAEVWTTTRLGVPGAMALPLFQAATALRRTLPTDLPPQLTVFRGVAAESEADAHAALGALSWTRDRTVAGRYAHGHMDWRRRTGQPAGKPWIGCAVVDRGDVLAWFNQRDDNEVVVAPSGLHGLTVEPHLD